MAFNGVELLEVAESRAGYPIVLSGGNYILHIIFPHSNTASSENMLFSIMNTETGESLEYLGPSIGKIYTDNPIAGYWDESTSKWYIVSRAAGNTRAWVRSITTSGTVSTEIDTSYLEAYATYMGIAANQSWVQILGYGGYLGKCLKKSNNSITSISQATNSIVESNGSWWVTSGQNLYLQTPGTDSRTLVRSFDSTPSRKVTKNGDWIWWRGSSDGTPYIGWNKNTDVAKIINLTPGDGIPTISGDQYPVVVDGMIYSIINDATRMLVIEIDTGRWKLDNLITSRSGRVSAASGNGKLWIPSTVTPP